MSTEGTWHAVPASLTVPGAQKSNASPQDSIELSDQVRVATALRADSPRHAAHTYTCWAVLAAYTLFLLTRGLYFGHEGDARSLPLWQLQDSRQLLAWMGGLIFRAFCQFACFAPLGFVTALVISRGLGRSGRLAKSLLIFVGAGAVAVLVQAVEIGLSWRAAAAVALVLPVLGSLFGAWIGAAWLRGRRARLWLLPKVASLAVLVALGAGVLLWRAVQDAPLPFESARVTSAEKRRLVHLIRSKNPRSLIEGQTHTLELTEHDIDVLLAWGLSLGSPNRKAGIQLRPDAASLTACVGVKLGGGKTGYLNLVAAVLPEMREGVVSLHLKHLQLGAVQTPRWLLHWLSPVVTSLLRHDRRSKPFLEAVRAVAVETGVIRVTYGPVYLNSQGLREDLFGPAGAGEAVLASTRTQVEQLLVAASQAPNGQPTFGMCFETAFTLARDRSLANDPVTENRAAIFALGMLLGHPRVEEFLGPVHAGRGHYAERRALSRVRLRGRSDWSKHFCVAAAIALLSDEVVSDAASLLKEELDAEIGGSGFSFSDLLAARAGTTFATQATRNEAAARAMQERIAGGFRVDDLCPDAADLPEGIGDAELQARYGGVGGPMYNQLIEEIERRIAACAAYR